MKTTISDRGFTTAIVGEDPITKNKIGVWESSLQGGPYVWMGSHESQIIREMYPNAIASNMWLLDLNLATTLVTHLLNRKDRQVMNYRDCYGRPFQLRVNQASVSFKCLRNEIIMPGNIKPIIHEKCKPEFTIKIKRQEIPLLTDALRHFIRFHSLGGL